MIRVSCGTASVLGLSKINIKNNPTTAYLMLGDSCNNNCKFCSQGKDSQSNKNYLSRVNWSIYNEDLIFENLSMAFRNNNLKRACLQVVNNDSALNNTLSTLKKISAKSNIPICASSTVTNIHQAKELFESGLDRLCVALDVASEKLFNDIKGKEYEKTKTLLTQLAQNFPHKITTHIIVGLGETQLDLAKTISFLAKADITIALFAFTPVRGTLMQKHPKPDLTDYRKIQLLNYLFQTKQITLDNLVTDNDKIIGFKRVDSIDNKIDKNLSFKIKNMILNSKGKAFQTSGCPDCNRPYYNETPNETPYNYPYQPTEKEITNAVNCIDWFRL